MSVFSWVLAAFLSGAAPYSILIGRYGLKKDIRNYGDGNPGAANVWRAGGPRWGIAAILLDFFKGFVPVGLANILVGFDGYPLLGIALAPILGHAFSPFLRWRGGKALAVTFGVWAGLSLFLVPLVLGALFGLGLYLLSVEGWAVFAGMLGLIPLFIVLPAPMTWWLVWLGNTLILVWSHRTDFRRPPHLSGRAPV